MLHDVLQKIFLLIIIYRLLLAALQYNENSDRLQAVTKDGRPYYTIRFPKFKKGDYSVRKEKTCATYGIIFPFRVLLYIFKSNQRYKYWLLIAYILFQGYTETLLDMLIREYEEDQTSLKNSIQDLRESMPAPLSASFEKPCKETAVEQYVSRFAHHWVTRKVITANHVCVFVYIAHLLPVLQHIH